MEKTSVDQLNTKRTMFGTGERDYSVDTMRCISCFMVVAGHVSASIINGFPLCDSFRDISSTWLLLEFMRCAAVSATNLFLMISGIFFLSPEREVSITKIWSKNILKLAMAYVVWSAIYALLRIYYSNPQPFSWGTFWSEFLVEEYHLWYIPMMLGIYVLVPLMRMFTQKAERKQYLYMIGLMIFAMALYTIVIFYHEYPFPHGDTICAIIDKLPVMEICQYPFYCILGYYVYTYKPKLKTRLFIYFVGILGLILTVYLTSFLYVKSGIVNSYNIQDKFLIGIFAKNTALFVFITTVFSKVRFSVVAKKVLSKLSAATLFIYLCHVFILKILMGEGYIVTGQTPVSQALGFSLMIYVVGFVFSLIFLQAIPWVRMRNVVLDAVWPNRRIWVTRKKKQKTTA